MDPHGQCPAWAQVLTLPQPPGYLWDDLQRGTIWNLGFDEFCSDTSMLEKYTQSLFVWLQYAQETEILMQSWWFIIAGKLPPDDLFYV